MCPGADVWVVKCLGRAPVRAEGRRSERIWRSMVEFIGRKWHQIGRRIAAHVTGVLLARPAVATASPPLQLAASGHFPLNVSLSDFPSHFKHLALPLCEQRLVRRQNGSVPAIQHCVGKEKCSWCQNYSLPDFYLVSNEQHRLF